MIDYFSLKPTIPTGFSIPCETDFSMIARCPVAANHSVTRYRSLILYFEDDTHSDVYFLSRNMAASSTLCASQQGEVFARMNPLKRKSNSCVWCWWRVACLQCRTKAHDIDSSFFPPCIFSSSSFQSIARMCSWRNICHTSMQTMPLSNSHQPHVTPR